MMIKQLMIKFKPREAGRRNTIDQNQTDYLDINQAVAKDYQNKDESLYYEGKSLFYQYITNKGLNV